MHESIQIEQATVRLSLIFRDRKNLKDREDAWLKIEHMAAVNSSKSASILSAVVSHRILSQQSITTLIIGLELQPDREMVVDIEEDDVEMMTASPVAGEEEDSLAKDISQFEDRLAPSRFRRKSVLPVDADVMTELSRHKSLEDLISSKEKT